MWLSYQDYTLPPSKTEGGEAPCEFAGEEVQRLSVVQNLPQLLQGNEQLCLQRVVPKVQLALPNASTEFHMAASTTFKTILEKKLVNPRTFTQTFLQSILSSIDSRDPVVANAWLETLLDVIDLLPPDVVRTDIVPIAVSKGQISQKLPSRITACKLLGKISTRVDLQTLKKDALPVVLSLCQDVKAEVRACICSQLPSVAKGLGAEGLKPSILPLLVELASDEEAIVRLSAVGAIVSMLPNLQQDIRTNIIVPLVKKMCESSLRNEDSVMVMLAQVFGELCLGLDGSLTMPEKRWLINYFQQLAELGLRSSDREATVIRRNMPDLVPQSNNADKLVECRHYCAYHFPAMVRFATSSLDDFRDELCPVFYSLASDPYYEVRRTIACGLHEVTRHMGSNATMIRAELVKLLRDDAEDVLTGLVPNLSVTLTLLSQSGNINSQYMDSSSLEVGRALLKCESQVSSGHNWRLHETLLIQLECLHLVLPSDFIHMHFTPILFTTVNTGRQVPVRVAATNTLLVFLRYNVKNSQRNEIRSRIVSEFCHGRSCYSRQSFMRLCSQALNIFSRKYFKEHFLLEVLSLAEDRVPNIRLMFVRLLPRMKRCLRMPSDKKYFAAMEASIRTLVSAEKDRDVLACLSTTLQVLDNMECVLDSAKVTSQSPREDQEDQKRMEEEISLEAPPGRKGDSNASPSQKQQTGVKTNVTTLQRTQQQQQQQQQTRPLPSTLQKRSPPSSVTRNTIQPPGNPSTARGVSQPRPDPNTARRNITNTTPGLASTGTLRDKDVFTSLEEEFYRDAGIKIPQHFASSPLPSRIPSMREGLFKSEHVSRYEDEGKLDLGEDGFKERESSADSKGSRSTADVSGKKIFGTKLAAPRKSFAQHETEKSLGSKGPANRRHSYLAGEQTPKTSLRIEEGVGLQRRTMSVVDNSRRHSYIERLQISTAESDSRSDASKRRSLHVREEQAQRGQTAKPAIPLRKNANRTDTTSRRKSVGYTQRGSSASTERTELTDGTAKRRSLVAPSSTPKFTSSRRHSSLEREDQEKTYGQRRTYGSGYVGRRVQSPQNSREDLRTETKRQSFSSDENLFETRLRRPGYRKSDGNYSVSPGRGVGSGSKIPRSNNSSPGNSRSSSPSGTTTRARHLTAPNSRAGSPTAANKRLSLGTLNSYMSNIKLTEPSSKLPVRKK